MYKEINEEIYLVKEELRAKEKLESLRKIAQDEYNKSIQMLEELKDRLNKEKKDVAKLEGTSLSSFFFSIIGKKDEKLDKEMKEYLAAKMKYDEHLVTINELKNLINKYDEELRRYEGIEERHKKLINEKQRLLINEDSSEGRNLRQLLGRLNELRLDIKEIKEAVNAGRNAYDALLEMEKALDSAKGWRVWDLLGGGFFQI